MTATEQVISQLKGSLKENLPLTFNTDEIRALLKAFEHDKKPTSLNLKTRFKVIPKPKLIFNAGEIRTLLADFEHDKMPPSLYLSPKFNDIKESEAEMFRGKGAEGNFVRKIELGFWASLWSKIWNFCKSLS